ncbi:MAG: glucose 1-dehydrogenase [Candidatus Aminicenantes bacterium]|nr:glucose 1-dehydrogenase [Candidatus Aminicenantes bacterium]
MKNERRELQDKVAIVTGGGRGIGRAIAAKIAEAGAEVIVADIDSALAKKTAQELSEEYGEPIGVQVDVAQEESVEAMTKMALKKFGRVDILINNAGTMFRTRFQEISVEEWKDTLLVNLTGPFLCTRALLPTMKKNSYGRIVNISSSAGRSVSTLGGAHYTASKAGLLGFTRAVAKEVASFGITINAVCPGLIDTQMVRNTTTKEELDAFMNSFPIQRLGLPQEVGDLVVFLCTEKASYITGATVDINGGDLMI